MRRRPATRVVAVGDPVQDVLAAVAAKTPVDERERVSIERFLAEVPRLERPFDEHADPVHITGSALIVGRRGIVLLRHKSLGIWVQPGGHIDAGELPWEAAAREAGRGDRAGDPPVRRSAAARSRRRAPRAAGHTHLDLRYVVDGGDADPTPPPEESQHVAWFDWADAQAIADHGLAGVLPTLKGR